MVCSESAQASGSDSMNVLAVIAHPDDEVIGCGGTLAKMAQAGDDVRVLLPLKRGDPRGVEHWSELLNAFSRSCDVLGITAIVAKNLMDERDAPAKLHALHDEIVTHVEQANMVFTHWLHDANQTHCAISRAVEIATRPFRRRKDVYLFETSTSTDQTFFQSFSANAYSLLDDLAIRKKCKAMTFYETESHGGRSPDSLLRKAQQRGDEINASYAEAFHIARCFF